MAIETSPMSQQKQAFFSALQFLTVLPTPRNLDSAPAVQGLSLLWYPAVGLLLGVFLSVSALLLPLPFYLNAVIVVSIWAMVTGGLHLDGLADCADAWLGGLGDRERTLEILKDPLCGSMAVVALVLLLLLKVVAVTALIDVQWAGWLWTIPLIARTSLLVLFLSTPYVRPQGLGEVLAIHFSRVWAKRVVLFVAVVLFFVFPFTLWLAAILVTSLTAFVIRRAALSRLGGFTGDVAGAQVEIIEVVLLILLAYYAGA